MIKGLAPREYYCLDEKLFPGASKVLLQLVVDYQLLSDYYTMEEERGGLILGSS